MSVFDGMVVTKDLMGEAVQAQSRAFVFFMIAFMSIIKLRSRILIEIPLTGEHHQLRKQAGKLSTFIELLDVKDFEYNSVKMSKATKCLDKLEEQGRPLPEDTMACFDHLLDNGVTNMNRLVNYSMSEEEKAQTTTVAMEKEEAEKEAKKQALASLTSYRTQAKEIDDADDDDDDDDDYVEGGGGGGDGSNKAPRLERSASASSSSTTASLRMQMPSATIAECKEATEKGMLMSKIVDLEAKIARRDENIKLSTKRLLDEIKVVSCGTVKKLLSQADAAFAHKNYVESGELYGIVCAHAPNSSAHAWAQRGLCFLECPTASEPAVVAETEKCFHKALELDPNFFIAHFNLGVLFSDYKKDFDSAVACFRKAIEASPSHLGNLAASHFNLGVLLHYKNDIDSAEACFRKAIEFNPDYDDAHMNLGNLLKGRADAEEEKSGGGDPMVVAALRKEVEEHWEVARDIRSWRHRRCRVPSTH